MERSRCGKKTHPLAKEKRNTLTEVPGWSTEARARSSSEASSGSTCGSVSVATRLPNSPLSKRYVRVTGNESLPVTASVSRPRSGAAGGATMSADAAAASTQHSTAPAAQCRACVWRRVMVEGKEEMCGWVGAQEAPKLVQCGRASAFLEPSLFLCAASAAPDWRT